MTSQPTVDNPARVAIVGGGIAGLSAAWELRQLMGPRVHILLAEAYDRLGGKLKSVDFAGGPVDMGAEAFLGFRQDFADLVTRVGLGDQLRKPSGLPSSLFVDGKLMDMPTNTLMGIPADGASVSDIVGADAAARIDAEKTGQPMTWEPGQDASVGQLVEARLGRSVVDRLVTPMLGGVYSTGADDLGVRATLPQLATALEVAGRDQREFFLTDVIADLLKSRKATAAEESRPAPPVFYSLEGGFRSLVRAMAEQSGAEVLYNSGVEAIGRNQHGWYIEPIGVVDAVILAAPAPTTSVLLQDMAPVAAEALDAVDLASSVVVGMRFASDHGIPERSGVLLGPDAPTEAKAFTFSSKKWPHLAQRGGALVRASFGTYREPWYVEADERALVAYALEDLYAVTGERKRPEEFFVQRWWGGLPRYGVGHGDLMERAFADVRDIPGLALAGSMLGGVGIPATSATGVAAAREIVDEMGWSQN